MRSHRLLLLIIAASVATSHAAEERTPSDKPGIFKRMLSVFQKKEREPKLKAGNLKQLDMAMTVEPKPLKLSDTKQLKVTLTLTNKGKKLVQLEFPTSQRIEVLLKNKVGKLVEQWSEDQAFVSEPTLVTINPGERLEYAASVSTRDLVAGESYWVEAFFPNFDQLRKVRTVVPEK